MQEATGCATPPAHPHPPTDAVTGHTTPGVNYLPFLSYYLPFYGEGPTAVVVRVTIQWRIGGLPVSVSHQRFFSTPWRFGRGRGLILRHARAGAVVAPTTIRLRRYSHPAMTPFTISAARGVQRAARPGLPRTPPALDILPNGVCRTHAPSPAALGSTLWLYLLIPLQYGRR